MKSACVCFFVFVLGFTAWNARAKSAASTSPFVHLDLRSRAVVFPATGKWDAVTLTYDFNPKKAAVIVCDMWDKHWCGGATRRVGLLVERLQPFLDAARRNGITIVHAPSETMAFYRDTPQRQKMLELANVEPPAELDLKSPALPIDDSDGGCDTGEKEYRAWTREHPGLRIDPADYVSDNGHEIYNLLRTKGIDTVFYTGVHTNMCILNRSFAIKQMSKWGMHCILLRDLTDAMYNPQDRPYVSHEQGTELVIEHIEKYWAPTSTSEQLERALAGM
jgi:nicotinamidase-related amidase